MELLLLVRGVLTMHAPLNGLQFRKPWCVLKMVHLREAIIWKPSALIMHLPYSILERMHSVHRWFPVDIPLQTRIRSLLS